MLRTASSLPLKGPLTLGFDPARFQTKPPACYRASWQLPGPDSHRQATTSLQTISPAATSRPYLQFCWAHRKASMDQFAGTGRTARSLITLTPALMRHPPPR
jgi:hypothetical protein